MSAAGAAPPFASTSAMAMAQAIAGGNQPELRRLIATRADVNEAGANGLRLLHLAMMKRNAGMIEALLAAGARPDAPFPGGDTPLHQALASEDLGLVQTLLAAGANPNAPDGHGQPPIHRAVMANRPEMLQPLVHAGAALNAVWTGVTPVMAAVEALLFPMAVRLLELGADATTRDGDGRSLGDSLCEIAGAVRLTGRGREAARALAVALAAHGIAVPCELGAG